MDNTRRDGITYLSLCSGYDGIGLGLELAGVRVAFAIHVEVEAFASWNLVNKIQAGAMGPGVLYPDVKTFPFGRFRGTINLLSAGFPCFAAGTLVLCEDGYKPIEDVQVGDSVLTHKGRWGRVTGIMQRPGASIRRIESYGCGDILTTDEHPFYVRERGHTYSKRKRVRTFSEPEWTDAKDLSRNSFVGQVLPPVGDDGHSNDFWWLVGRYLADGWTQFDKSQSCGRTIICCNKGETSELRRRIGLAGFHASMSEERTANKFHIVKKSLYDFLQPFGRYAHGKKLPKCALELPEEKAKALIEGYLSGDGHHESNPRGSGKKWRVGTVSERLAYGMSMLAHRAFGVCAQVRTYTPKRDCVIEGRNVNERIRYIVEIPERNRESFVDGDWAWKPVRRNESIGTGTVFNISVEEDESYIVNGAVVHNCQPFSHAGKGQADEDPRHLFPFIKRGIEAACPDWVFLENVDGLISKKLAGDGWNDPAGTPVLLHVLRELEREGYRATWGVFSAAEVGAPHQRKRVFILAKRVGPGVQSLLDDDAPEPDFPISGFLWPSRPGRGQWWWEAPRVLRGGELDDPLRNGLWGHVAHEGEEGRAEGQDEVADPIGNGTGGIPGNGDGEASQTCGGGEEDAGPDKAGDGSSDGTTEGEVSELEHSKCDGQYRSKNARGDCEAGDGVKEGKDNSCNAAGTGGPGVLSDIQRDIVKGEAGRRHQQAAAELGDSEYPREGNQVGRENSGESGVTERRKKDEGIGTSGTSFSSSNMADTGHAVRGTGPSQGCSADQRRDMAKGERGEGADETAQCREDRPTGKLADTQGGEDDGRGRGVVEEAAEGREGVNTTPGAGREDGPAERNVADPNGSGQRQGNEAGQEQPSEQSDGDSVPPRTASEGQLADPVSRGQQDGPMDGSGMEEGGSGRPTDSHDGAAASKPGGSGGEVADPTGSGLPECDGERSRTAGQCDAESQCGGVNVADPGGEGCEGSERSGTAGAEGPSGGHATECGRNDDGGHEDRGQDMGNPAGQGLPQREAGGQYEPVQAAQYADGEQEGRQAVPEMGGSTDVFADGMGYAELLETKIFEAVGCGDNELAAALEQELLRFTVSRGVDARTDELRLLGNGVVPPCAATAFVTLYRELVEAVGSE